MSEANKAIVRRYREIYNTSQLDRLEEVLTADFTPHATFPGMPWNGLESARQVHMMTKAIFPDLHTATEDLIAEGDLVVERWTQTQTHSGGPFFIGNIPPSGKRITTTGISIYRIKGGKIVEHWADMDFLGVLQQVGAVPMPG
ncbi:MAG: ester cyclase [Chloroflexi bacterium]|nr:ester cyclase [Chloroflexota bacterium]